MAEGGAVAFDTSAILAALLGWHEHHARAWPVLEAALTGGGRVVIPLPALVEAYSVMTRLPPGQRLRGDDALAVLSATFEGTAEVVAIEGAEGWAVLRSALARAGSGGATYDAHIVACARKAGVRTLVTFNERHFARLDLGPIKLQVPAPA